MSTETRTDDLMPEDHATLSRVLDKLLQVADGVQWGHEDGQHYLQVDDTVVLLSSLEYDVLAEVMSS